MDWQWFGVVITVSAAAAYLARQTWRSWFKRNAGCSGCSCATKTEIPREAGGGRLIPSDELTARLRRR